MTNKKFKKEIDTLIKFIFIYCRDKHSNQICKDYFISYNDLDLRKEICLCNECHKLLNYAINKLQNCPHEIKPRCRKCSNLCYDKSEWRKMAKIMRYAGMKLRLLKTKQKLNNLITLKFLKH